MIDTDLPLPCPLPAGWELIHTVQLPAQGTDGLPLGGFSAAAYQPQHDRLWLLSDAPRGHLVPWGGLAKLLAGRASTLTQGPRLLLRDTTGQPLSHDFDGEGLVLQGRSAWIASEGRRTSDRPARLIQIDLGSGQQQQQLPLPPSWRASPGRGLAANKGPESLTALAPSELLLAAERPLLQNDAVAAVPLARSSREGALRAAGSLDLGSDGQEEGLTDLLALPVRRRLLAIIRGYRPPFTWTARLLLFPYPQSSAPPLQSLVGWDLLAEGLPADNWEALAIGPPLPDGRTTLVLATDDNFNPLQANWIAVLAPRRTSACSD